MLPNQPALLDETDRKLYTLLALRELGGCTHTQLLYFMFENDIMSYFDLALALHELVDEGQLVRTNHPLDYLYAPTSAGLETLSFFINRLPHSKVVLICDRAPAWKQRFQREKQYAAKVAQNASGEYVVQLNLVEGNVARLSIDLPVPEHAMAERMARIGGVNIKELGRQLFSPASGKSVEELVNSDFKEFHIGEQNLGVGQVTCLDSVDMLKRKGEFLDVMRRLQEEHHYNMVILMLTDVLLEGTQLLYVGSDEAIRNAFSAEPKDNALFLPGVMSRKKQVIPMLSALWG